jgi:hypothetical protein
MVGNGCRAAFSGTGVLNGWLTRAAGSNGAALTGGEQVADLLQQHDVVGIRSRGLLFSETLLDFFVWGDEKK